MKTVSLLITIACTFVALVAGSESDGLRGSSSPGADNTRHLQRGNNDSSSKVKVLVQYKTEKGSEDAKKRATAVGYESKRFKVVAMEIDESEIQELENDANIQSVSLDQEMHIIFPIKDYDEFAAQSQHPKGPPPRDSSEKPPREAAPRKPFNRRLVETEPYGVAAVEADKVSPGPDAGDIKVCIVDTGYDLGHPDLPALGIVNGQDNDDYNNEGDWDLDGHGHGTHCAGIVAAIGDNNEGVRGAVMNAELDGITLHIGKGLANDGYGTGAGVLKAFDQCVDAGARVVSMSLGGSGWSQQAQNLYQTAYEDLGVLIVAAASNDGNSAYSYPASYPAVMSVAATDSSNERASFSNFNDQVEISAPGVSVMSTLPLSHPDGPYDAWSGTSMATPYVAGVAALLWSYNSTCSPQQIRKILLASAKPLAPDGCDFFYGRGLVQAEKAKNMLLAGGCEAADSKGIFESSNGLNDGNTCENFVAPCSLGEQTLTLTLQTDSNPTETSWEVKNEGGVQVRFGSGYGASNTLVTETVVLCSGETYSFTMMDSAGNGISGNGAGYSLALENEMVRPFGTMVGSSETTSDIFAACPLGQGMISFDLLTDNYPDETTWELKHSSNGNIMYSGGPYSLKATQYLQHMCVDSGTWYEFTIWDLPYKDGICCDYGIGNYSLMVDNTIVITNDGDFGEFETHALFVPEVSVISEQPSEAPSSQPSTEPTNEASSIASSSPSTTPSLYPSGSPSAVLSSVPSTQPSNEPTETATGMPSSYPSSEPSITLTELPSDGPSSSPSSLPSSGPTDAPSNFPSLEPSVTLTETPSDEPSNSPSRESSASPSSVPSNFPSMEPSVTLTEVPSDMPSSTPSLRPSVQPSSMPSNLPSSEPSVTITEMPSDMPSSTPSLRPSVNPSGLPSVLPSGLPSFEPSVTLTEMPSFRPSSVPSGIPSAAPSDEPSSLPSFRPSPPPTVDIADVQVTQLVLVDALTDEDIPGAFACTPFVCTNGARIFNIRADTMDEVKSVRLGLDGPVSQVPRVESAAPYSLFQDNNGDYFGVALEPGDYTMTAEPFSLPDAGGVGGPMMTMNFTIGVPTAEPSSSPSLVPSMAPSGIPSNEPSSTPSVWPSFRPSATGSESPSTSISPSIGPSMAPSGMPSDEPSSTPSAMPPSSHPSFRPSGAQTESPSTSPSNEPSGEPSNTPSAHPSPQPSNEPSSVEVTSFTSMYINAGSGSYTDSEGITWSADAHFNTGRISNARDRDIGGTNDPELYRTERYDVSSGEDLVYNIAVPNGDYEVVMYFSENYSGAQTVGGRVFNVAMEGTVVFPNLDIFVESGGPNQAMNKTAQVAVSDGSLTIEFGRVKQNPKVAAIAIHQVGVAADAPVSDMPSVAPSRAPTTPDVLSEIPSIAPSSTPTIRNSVSVMPSWMPSATTPPFETLRINCGSSSYTDVNGNVWDADAYFNTGRISNARDRDIGGTDDDVLYRTERYDVSTGEDLVYNITDIPNGDYDVTLFFSENYSGAQKVNGRVFDVSIEGILEFASVDIFVESGGPNLAMNKTATTTVTDGALTIEFGRIIQNPKVAAIQVEAVP